MIATPGEADLSVPVPESFHEQTDEELTENDIKRMDADDQAIQTILLGLPEDVYAALDSCETAKEIWEPDFTQIYDFLKMNQDEVNELRAERLAKTHDPLALMAHSQNSYNFLATHNDQSSSNTHSQKSFPINNKYNPQPSLNQNFMQPQMTSLEDINDPTEAMNAALILFAKASQQTSRTNNNQRTSSNPHNRVQNGGNQNGLVLPGIANQNGTSNVVAARAGGTGNGNQARCYNCRGLGHIARNYTAIPRRRDHASTSGTQIDKAPVYDTDGSAEVELYDNCYGNEIFNMFTLEEQYTDLLEPIPEPQLVPQNDNHITFVAPSMVQSGGTVETSSAPNEETQEHDPPVVDDSEETPELSQESREKMKFLKKEIKPVNYAKINHLSGEKEYDVLWNNWYTKCEEFKYDKISYDKAYNDMQQKVERLQAQLRDFKGKSSDTPSALNTLDLLNKKLKSKIVELEFQVVNYKREISHLKTTYKNLFDSITSNREHAKLHNLIYENAQLRAWVFENTSESMNNTSGTSVTPHVDKPKLSIVTPHSKKLHASILSHSVPQPREFNVVNHRNVIAPGMFKINPSQTSRENVSFDTVNASSIGLVHTARTRRPQPKGNIRNTRVPSASKSSEVKKNVIVEDHRRTLFLSKNQKTMSYELNSRVNNLCANASPSANQKRHRTQVWKPKQVGFKKILAPKPRLPRFSLKWSPSRRSFDLKGKLVASKETNCPNDDKACTSNPQEPMRKWFPNSTVFLGRLSKFVCGASTRVVPSI
nr:hypothetical protein [Tanacetum cinerariifolium]